MHDPVYLENEHRILHNQLRRFIDEAVLPNGEAQKGLELMTDYVKTAKPSTERSGINRLFANVCRSDWQRS